MINISFEESIAKVTAESEKTLSLVIGQIKALYTKLIQVEDQEAVKVLYADIDEHEGVAVTIAEFIEELNDKVGKGYNLDASLEAISNELLEHCKTLPNTNNFPKHLKELINNG